MSDTVLGRAKIPIEGDLSKLDKDLSSARSKVSSAVDGIVANVQKVGSAALAGVGIVSGVAAGAATALSKLAIDAAPVQGLQDAFAGLAESSGKSMDEMLSALQRGSSGMISQRDLMQTYNKAGQLVSVTFANQLPDAMDALSKVSASTGQDMGFMLDSLVTGVGRLSPMILDNLGILVSLEEATQRAAASFGVEASELDKAQVQAGMMEVVLEKLAANTAAMPDVSDSAAAGLARMKATAQDTKDALGLALQPALSGVMEGVSDLAEKFLPVLIDFFEQRVAPVVAQVAEFFQIFATNIAEGASPVEALKDALVDMGLEDVAAKIEDVVDKVIEFRDSVQLLWDKVNDFLKPISDFISENVILQDVLFALAAIILATVVPAVVSWVISMGPILLVVMAVIAIVALLRKLCEDDFALLKQAWAAVGQAFEDVGIWIGDTVDGIKTWLSNAWASIKKTAADTWTSIKTTATELWEAIKATIETKVNDTKRAIEDKWNAIKTWLADTMASIKTTATELWEAIKATIETKVNNTKQAIENKWNAIKTWLADTWTSIKTTATELWEAIKATIETKVNNTKQAIEDKWNAIKTWLADTMAAIRDNMSNAWEDAKDSVIGNVEEMIGRVRQLWSDMEAAGRHLVDGLKAGISNAWDSFLGWLKGLLNDVLGSILSFFGIGSPSRVFAEIGENLMLGLAEGIGGGVTVPITAMVQAGQDLTHLAGRPGDGRGGLNPAAGGVTIYGGLALYGVQDAQGLLGELRALAT